MADEPQKQQNIILIHGMTRGARNAIAVLSICFFVAFLALTLGELRFQDTQNKFNSLQDGLCTILNGANKAQPLNKELLTTQANRARQRAKLDRQSGSPTAAQGDLDYANFLDKIANQQKPINVKPFGCEVSPPPPASTTSTT